MENEKKFTGVFIPAHIYEMEELSWQEKILWCEIQALAGNGVCYASNEYFAKKFHSSPVRISHIISKLKKIGLVEQVYFDGRVRHLKVKFDIQGSIDENDISDYTKMTNQTSQKSIGSNNIYNNNINNNNLNKNINKNININIPTLDDCKKYAKELHCIKELGIDFYNYYSLSGWVDGKGKKILRWKQKMYQWYLHDKEKYYDDIPEPHFITKEEMDNFKRAEPLRTVE